MAFQVARERNFDQRNAIAEQRQQDYESRAASADQAKSDRQSAADEKNQWNSAAQEDENNTGKRYQLDPATGRKTPVMENGRQIYNPTSSKEQTDPATGVPYVENRDKYGNVTRVNPGNKDLTDTNIWTQNQNGDWDAIPAEQAIQSGPTPAKLQAAKVLWTQEQQQLATQQNALQEQTKELAKSALTPKMRETLQATVKANSTPIAPLKATPGWLTSGQPTSDDVAANAAQEASRLDRLGAAQKQLDDDNNFQQTKVQLAQTRKQASDSKIRGPAGFLSRYKQGQTSVAGDEKKNPLAVDNAPAPVAATPDNPTGNPDVPAAPDMDSMQITDAVGQKQREIEARQADYSAQAKQLQTDATVQNAAFDREETDLRAQQTRGMNGSDLQAFDAKLQDFQQRKAAAAQGIQNRSDSLKQQWDGLKAKSDDLQDFQNTANARLSQPKPVVAPGATPDQGTPPATPSTGYQWGADGSLIKGQVKGPRGKGMVDNVVGQWNQQPDGTKALEVSNPADMAAALDMAGTKPVYLAPPAAPDNSKAIAAAGGRNMASLQAANQKSQSQAAQDFALARQSAGTQITQDTAAIEATKQSVQADVAAKASDIRDRVFNGTVTPEQGKAELDAVIQKVSTDHAVDSQANGQKLAQAISDFGNGKISSTQLNGLAAASGMAKSGTQIYQDLDTQRRQDAIQDIQQKYLRGEVSGEEVAGVYQKLGQALPQGDWGSYFKNIAHQVVGAVSTATAATSTAAGQASKIVNPVSLIHEGLSAILPTSISKNLPEDASDKLVDFGNQLATAAKLSTATRADPRYVNDYATNAIKGGIEFAPAMMTGGAGAVVMGGVLAGGMGAQDAKDAGLSPLAQTANFALNAAVMGGLQKIVGPIKWAHDGVDTPALLKVLQKGGPTTQDILTSLAKNTARVSAEGTVLNVTGQAGLYAGGDKDANPLDPQAEANSVLGMLPFALLGVKHYTGGIKRLAADINSKVSDINTHLRASGDNEITPQQYMTAMVNAHQGVQATEALTGIQKQFAKIDANTALAPDDALAQKSKLLSAVPEEVRPQVMAHLDAITHGQTRVAEMWQQADEAVAKAKTPEEKAAIQNEAMALTTKFQNDISQSADLIHRLATTKDGKAVIQRNNAWNARPGSDYADIKTIYAQSNNAQAINDEIERNQQPFSAATYSMAKKATNDAAVNFDPAKTANDLTRRAQAADPTAAQITPDDVQGATDLVGKPGQTPRAQAITDKQKVWEKMLQSKKATDPTTANTIYDHLTSLERQKTDAHADDMMDAAAAHKEIAQAPPDTAPAARGLVKVGVGKRLGLLTSSELHGAGIAPDGKGGYKALVGPDDLGDPSDPKNKKPIHLGPVQFDEMGYPHVTDEAKGTLAQTMPNTAKLIPSESDSRENAHDKFQAAEAAKAEAAKKAAEKPKEEPKEEPKSEEAAPKEEEKPSWTGVGENGTEVKIGHKEAKNETEAREKLAGKLPEGERLTDVTPPPVEPKEGEKPFKKTVRAGQFFRERMALKIPLKLDSKQKKFAQHVVDILAPHLDAYSDFFPGGIKFEAQTGGGGLTYHPKDKTLRIDLNNVAETIESQESVGGDANAAIRSMMRQEIIHRAAADKLTPKQVSDMWNMLDDRIKYKVKKSYYANNIQHNRPLPSDSENSYLMGHEFIRMLAEHKIFGEISESHYLNMKLIAALRDILSKLGDSLQAMLKDKTITNEETRIAVKANLDMVINHLHDLGVVEAKVAANPPPEPAPAPEPVQEKAIPPPESIPKLPPLKIAQKGNEGVAYTDNNDAIGYHWALAELDDLTISNHDTGAINPKYPQELQPRDRTTAGSQDQINDIANNANLDRLSHSDSVGGGAPIVGPEDGVVESGNGRLMGLRRAYDRDLPSIHAYRGRLAARAEQFGIDGSKVGDMKKPVLIRVRDTDVDRRKFAEQANVSPVAPMREVEIAKKDAGNLSPGVLDLFNPDENGDMFGASNHQFIRAFVSSVVPQTERPSIIDAKGGLSQTGMRRIRNALFSYAYGSNPEGMAALARMTESMDPEGKNLTAALLNAAPRFAAVDAKIKAGALHDVGISGDVLSATQKLVELRAKSEKVGDYLSQREMFDDPITPFQKEMLQYLDKNGRSAKKITDALNRYNGLVESAGDPRQADLLGGAAPTKESLWNLASKPIQSGEAKDMTLASGMPPVNERNALKVYNRLFSLQRSGTKLNPGQARLLETAERQLGQKMMFDEQEEQRKLPNFDYREMVQPALLSGRTPSPRDQLNLFDTLTPEQKGEVQAKGLDLFGSPLTDKGSNRTLKGTNERKPQTAGSRSDDDLFGGNAGPAASTPVEKPAGDGQLSLGELSGKAGAASGTGQHGVTGSSRGDRGNRQPSGGEDLFAPAKLPQGVVGDQGSGKPSDRGRNGGLSAKVPRTRPADAVRARPAVGSPERNHEIAEGDTLAPRGDVGKLNGNFTALRLLKTLDSEGRNATPDEKRQLAQYVGWGGLSQAFDDQKAYESRDSAIKDKRLLGARYANYGPSYAKESENYFEQAKALENWREKWGKWHDQLKAELTPEEYAAAKESTINAHYTSPDVIRAMWRQVQHMGFKGGKILEPAGGVGHFFGLMPESIANRSQLDAVELDKVSGRILKKLYPEADVQVAGFQDAKIPDNSVDLAISNVPFAKTGPYDKGFDAAKAPKFNLHNYFFAKAMQKVKPGGLVAFITTAHTMDSAIEQRKWLADRGELVGAVRLPNTAFNENAKTDVTTDIVYIRKPGGETPTPKENFGGLADVKAHDGKPIKVNEYFARHPENILGKLADDGSMYGNREKGEMTVHPHDNAGPIGESIDKTTASLPKDILSPAADRTPDQQSTDDILKKTRDAKVGSIQDVGDGKLAIAGTADQDEDILKSQNRQLAKNFIGLRDALNEQYRMELDPTSKPSDIEANRAKLNAAYDQFRRDHGAVHGHSDLLGVDPDYYRLLGAEDEKKPDAKAGQDGNAMASRKKVFEKGAVFRHSVLTPRSEPTHADTVTDAMGTSLGWRGRMDTAFMAKLTDRSQEEVEKELLDKGLAYRNPETGTLETRDAYLSGNVRKKLAVATEAAKPDPAYKSNVEELQKVQPADIPLKDIKMRLGSTWIPSDTIQDFAREAMGSDGVEVTFHPGIGDTVNNEYEVRYSGMGSRQMTSLTPQMRSTFGTDRISGIGLLEKALNLKQPKIYDKMDDGSMVFNPTATTQAEQAMQKIKDAFEKWVGDNPTHGDALAKTYNEVNNSHVLRKYDGQFMQFPWLAKGFDLYPDKKDVVWRAVQDGRMLIAHGVGGGKTLLGTAISMEMKRLGLAKKPLIVAHNATLEQFAATINAMSPTARVLVARKADLEGSKRKEFMAKVAAGDWDAVIMAHSSFDMIPDDPAWQRQQIDDLTEQLDDAIRAKGANPNDDSKKTKDPTVKQLINRRNALKEKLEKLQDRKVDDVLSFQQLGVDMMIMDEAHEYKKMPFVTQLDNIAGIDKGASEKGTSLLSKSRWIQAQNKGKNVFTMTGTPITNTLGESWNMMRLVAPDLMKEFNATSFDNFVSTFADVKNSAELRANGSYKSVNRLAEMTNLPEWNKFFRLAADVKLGEDMVVKGRPAIKGGGAELHALELTPQVGKFMAYIKTVIDDYDRMSGKEKRENSCLPLLTYNAAKQAAIDIRLVDPQAADEPGSKVNVALKNILDLYKRTNDYRGTQVVFSDTFRPMKSTKLNMTDAELEAEEATGPKLTDEQEEVQAEKMGGFNLYSDIKRKLVAGGVPEKEIAIISDFKTDGKKAQLYQDVNDGKIRIVIGSRKKLGTGVNMQQRMIAAHHLDVPWTPAELEQSDGRVYRQGNIHAEMGVPIELPRYGMKDTLDAALWQKIETKTKFTKQVLSGKINSRSIEDDAGLLSLAEQKAVLSGPLGVKKFNADTKVRQLENEARAHQATIFDSKQQAYRLQRDQSYYADNKAELQKHQANIAGWSEKPFSASVDGATFDDQKEASEAVKAMFEARVKLAGEVKNPDASPAVNSPLGEITYKGSAIQLGKPKLSERIGEIDPTKKFSMTVPLLIDGREIGEATSGNTTFNRLEEHPEYVVHKLEGYDRGIVRIGKELEAVNEVANEAFPKQSALDKAYADQSDVMAEYAKKNEKPPVIHENEPLNSGRSIQTESPEFKKWFGDSKVVDESGKPLVVYHATTKDFHEFDRYKLGERTNHPASLVGFFFTKNPDVADYFLKGSNGYGDGDNIKSFYVSIKNPYTILNTDFHKLLSTMPEDREWAKSWWIKNTNDMRRAGYDGVYIPGSQTKAEWKELSSDTWVALDSTQIKSSIGNRGTFDGSDANILHAGRSVSDRDRGQGTFDLGLYRNPGEFNFGSSLGRRPSSEQRVTDGRSHARLVTENLGLATTIAKKFEAPGADVDDLIQEARIALLKAAQAFHPEQGTKFSSFASAIINNRLRDLYKSRIARSAHEGGSLDEEVGEDGDTRQSLTPDAAPSEPLPVERSETAKITEEEVAKLPDRPQAIVRAFMAGKSGEEIAASMGVTRQAVNQSLKGALMVLKKALERRGLKGQEEGILFSGKTPTINQTETPEFKQWFRDSQATDDSGKPAIFYHGTAYSEPFDIFDTLRPPEIRTHGGNSTGTWFTRNPDVASIHARGDNARIYPVYLSIKNPASAQHFEALRQKAGKIADIPKRTQWLHRQLKAEGYDGVRFLNGNWIALDSNQIKSATGNRGTFDSSDDSILHAGEPPKPRDDADNDLAHLFDNLNDDIPSEDEINAMRDRAGAEESGKQTIGNPNKANYGKSREERREVDVAHQLRADNFKKEEESGWINEAKERLAADENGVKKMILNTALSGKGFDEPWQVKAAQMLVPRLMREAIASGDATKRREAFKLAWAYDAGGSDQARAFAARRDPFKTPAERHMEFLTKMISTPDATTRAEIKAEPDPAKRNAMLTTAQDERYDKIVKALGDLGLTPDDVFSPDKLVYLKTTVLVQRAVANMGDAKLQKAGRMILDRYSSGQIAKELGISRKEAEDLQAKFDANLDVEYGKYLDQGMSVDRILANLRDSDLSRLFAGETPGTGKVTYTPEERAAALKTLREATRGNLDDVNAGKMQKRLKRRVDKPLPVKGSLSNVPIPPYENMKQDSIRPNMTPDELAEYNRTRRPDGSPADSQSRKQDQIRPDMTPEELAEYNRIRRPGNEPIPNENRLQKGMKFGDEPKPSDNPIPGYEPMKQDQMKPGLTPEEQAEFNRTRRPTTDPVDAARYKAAQDMYDKEIKFENVPFDPSSVEQNFRLARQIQAIDLNKFDMVYEAWINSILSGPQTHAMLSAGMGLNAAWNFTMQRGMEAAINAAFVHDPQAAQFGEFKHITKAVLPAISKALKFAAKVYGSEEHYAFEREALGTQMEFKGYDKTGGINASIPGTTGRVIRIPSRVVMAQDSFFKQVIGQLEATTQAYRIGKAMGHTGDDLSTFMRSQVNLPGSMAWQRAVKMAEEGTFQTQLRGWGKGGGPAEGMAKLLQDARHSDEPNTALGQVGQKMLGFVFPFIRTPYNIFRSGLAKTPLGAGAVGARIAGGLYRMAKGKPMFNGDYEKAAFVKDLATQTIAWASAALLYGSIEGDKDDDNKLLLITGSRPHGIAKQGEVDLANRTVGGPYQIRIGGRHGQYFNYGRIEPFATVLGTVADAMRIAKQGQDPAASLAKFGGYFKAQAEEKTFLQGISSISQAMDNMSSTDPGAATKGIVRQFLTGLVPNIIRQPLRNLDDFERDNRNASPLYGMTAIGGLANKKTDIYGGESEKAGNPLSRIVARSGDIPNSTVKLGDKFLVNWNRENPDKPFYPTAPTDHKYKDASGQKVNMTADQVSAYDKAVGKRFTEGMDSWLTPDMAANPTEDTKKMFESEHSKATREVKEEMFGGGVPVPTPRKSNDISSIFGWK